MQRQPLSLSEFSVNLRKHVDPKSPVPLRLMAAKSVIPMAPQEMALVLYQLSFDDNQNVQQTATDTLKNTPLDILTTALSKSTPPDVIDWAAGLFPHHDDVLELIVTNPSVAHTTVERVARAASATVCDRIAENQVRLLEHPDIIEALYMNPEARMSTVDKIVDLARRNDVSLDGLPALRPLMESDVPIVTPEEDDEVEVAATDEQADQMFSQFLSEALFEEDVASERQDDDEDDDGKVKKRLAKNRQHYLSQLRVPQKIRFAILGSREDRGYLIRDPNRMVHMAAVGSPKATEHDAINWSGNRVLPEGVISYIAGRREWFRNYQVKLNLVNNPKLPFRTALKLLPHLHPRDLKSLSRNRNVSAQLQRQAKALGMKRNTQRRK